MTSVAIPPSTYTQEEQAFEYLPARTFFQQMFDKEKGSPYQSTFTFSTFFTKMEEHIHDSQLLGCLSATVAKEEIEEDFMIFSNQQESEAMQHRREQVARLFPSLFFAGQLCFIARTFPKSFYYLTPALQDFFLSEEWEVKINPLERAGGMGSPTTEAGQLILEKLYSEAPSSDYYSKTITFRNKNTQLQKHFRVRVVRDFVEVVNQKPLAPLAPKDIHALYNDLENEDRWVKQFPPEDFSFKGFVIGFVQDVTAEESLSALKQMMLSENQKGIEDAMVVLEQLNGIVRSFLQMPDVAFGHLQHRDYKYANLICWSVLGDLSVVKAFSETDFKQSETYHRALTDHQIVITDDLQLLAEPSKVEQQLLRQGYRSLLLMPQKDSHNRVIGVMELASPEPYRFNKQTVDKLQEVYSLFTMGTHRWIQEVDNRIDFFIQEQFTYIHPSVQWKFREVSQKYLFAQVQDNTPATPLTPIVFKNVYPLYGQADIVGSSKIRNESIQADMLDNLQRVQKVLKAFRKRIPFQLLDIYTAKTEAFIQRLEKGGYVSSDESQIVELLVGDIHPLLRELSQRYSQLPKGILKKYFSYLDPKLDIVYRSRRAYENSVQALNEMVAAYIDKEVAKKQQLLPHFFEKYTTDGVEYNIYLGQSILEEGTFSDFFLQDFRLWQLLLMCEVTRLVENNKQKLPVPLDTAQLIFVYNNALSICFNLDEKQFDVDGAYNVRYEILKKRIDKAVIKGTKERLTQRGKIAIVWLQDKDRMEYLEYLHHLVNEGYITPNIEELELERLQGADGLKALRVTVAPQ